MNTPSFAYLMSCGSLAIGAVLLASTGSLVLVHRWGFYYG